MIEGCCFFLERSAYHVIQPTQLSAHLQAAGMVQSHARAFSGVWEAEASSVFLPCLAAARYCTSWQKVLIIDVNHRELLLTTA